jgi:hypothetical protein
MSSESSKFVSPKHLDAAKADTPFEIKMATTPEQLNDQKDVKGHTHVVIEKLSSINSTTVSDPTQVAFVKGVNTPADQKNQLNVNVTDGLPAGVYKLSSVMGSANHTPVIVPVDQHGAMDDEVHVGGIPLDFRLFP